MLRSTMTEQQPDVRPDDEDLLTWAEAAEMARMKVDALRYVYYQGRGPESFRMGKQRVFRRGKVRAWIAAIEAAQAGKRDVA
jgi:hypothetical protein